MRTFWKLVVAAVALLIAAAPLGAASASNHAVSPRSSPLYYVALGDSYAEGYQPGFANGSETLHGYTNQVAPLVAKRHVLILKNFGCGGATSSSILLSVGCPVGALANNGVAYLTTTQAASALVFIATHRGKIGLITVSIGGNDFDLCGLAPVPQTCLAAAMPLMQANIETLVAELRTVAGPKVPMIATSYPDVLLGEAVANPPNLGLAQLSLVAYAAIITPTLTTAYATQHVDFIDVATATGAFTPLAQTTTLAPYGVIPVAVADVCTMTWFCTKGDIHPTAVGYSTIAHLVAGQYLKLTK
jgi:lysophospholipase L1-like esterase